MKQIINPCITIIGWWIFKRKVIIHTWKRINISKFMSCSTTFHEHWKCEKCGLTKIDKFVEADDLILRGVSIKELENL